MNITYLFGAGASANSLPIVKNIPTRIERLIKELSLENFALDDKSFQELNLIGEKTKRKYQLDMIESFKWLHSESRRHASVDTLAKKLYLKSEYTKLNSLKTCLVIFFSIEEIINDPDKRYDAFLASLLDTSFSLPDNIKILSWNYDNQFEISFSDYTTSQSIAESENRLRIKSKLSSNNYDKGFSIYKLNGSTTFKASDDQFRKTRIYDRPKKRIDKELIHQITLFYAKSVHFNKLKPAISFAWEKDTQQSNIVENAVQDVSNTSILIVIGYSFPFFNREIDRRIISKMDNLEKVYFQSPDAKSLINRFQSFVEDIKKIELIPIAQDLNQFFLPYEL